MAFTVKEFHDLVRLLEEHPQWRAELRRLLLTDELLDLPRVVRELAEAQRETERRLASLTERVEDLSRQVQELTTGVNTLLGWQRGEAGCREGERYERSIVKRAPMLFSGGAGGPTDDPRVQERLSQWLRGLLDGERLLPSEEDPTLADLIWWKGDQVVVSVSTLSRSSSGTVGTAWRRRPWLKN